MAHTSAAGFKFLVKTSRNKLFAGKLNLLISLQLLTGEKNRHED